MPFSHNGLKTTTGICRYTAVDVPRVNKYTLSYRFLNGNVHGCVFAKNRPVSLNWSDYTPFLITIPVNTTRGHNMELLVPQLSVNAHMYSLFPSTVRIWNQLASNRLSAYLKWHTNCCSRIHHVNKKVVLPEQQISFGRYMYSIHDNWVSEG